MIGWKGHLMTHPTSESFIIQEIHEEATMLEATIIDMKSQKEIYPCLGLETELSCHLTRGEQREHYLSVSSSRRKMKT